MKQTLDRLQRGEPALGLRGLRELTSTFRGHSILDYTFVRRDLLQLAGMDNCSPGNVARDSMLLAAYIDWLMRNTPNGTRAELQKYLTRLNGLYSVNSDDIEIEYESDVDDAFYDLLYGFYVIGVIEEHREYLANIDFSHIIYQLGSAGGNGEAVSADLISQGEEAFLYGSEPVRVEKRYRTFGKTLERWLLKYNTVEHKTFFGTLVSL